MILRARSPCHQRSLSKETFRQQAFSVCPRMKVLRILSLREFCWEVTMIKKTRGGYKVLSEKTGKNLGGPYKTRAEAEKRLRQVEFFKHRKG